MALVAGAMTYHIAPEAFGYAEALPVPVTVTTLPSPTPKPPAVPSPSVVVVPTELPVPTAVPTQLPTVVPTATAVILSPTLAPTLLQPSPTGLPGTAEPTSQPPLIYYTQAGDTLKAVAVRFGVEPGEITASTEPSLPENALLNPGELLFIPRRLGETSPDTPILPDSEVVYSPSAVDFDIAAYVKQAGGYLSTYKEYLGSTGWTSGADVINRIALENSINPRLLLAVLEYQSHWVLGQPTNLQEKYYPIGILDETRKDLYKQLTWAVGQLSTGYYNWREARLTELVFPDGTRLRPAPNLNAGSVALQYLFAQLEDEQPWGGVLYSPEGFPALYERMFGSPWLRAEAVEPLFPPTLTQPVMSLPFIRGQLWSYTGGPHAAWELEPEGGWAALDFAPGSLESGCVKSDTWVVAAATGLVTRSANGLVVVDLDGDGHEETGWVMIYLHIATEGRVQAGKWVAAGDVIGHPSCEGGVATGTHVHIARKFNGEWIPADGPLPFTLSGWVAHSSGKPYAGTLTRGNETITACTCGSFETRIIRPLDDP